MMYLLVHFTDGTTRTIAAYALRLTHDHKVLIVNDEEESFAPADILKIEAVFK